MFLAFVNSPGRRSGGAVADVGVRGAAEGVRGRRDDRPAGFDDVAATSDAVFIARWLVAVAASRGRRHVEGVSLRLGRGEGGRGPWPWPWPCFLVWRWP